MHYFSDNAGVARLTPGLFELLSKLRVDSGFDPALYADTKARLLNEYLRVSKLSSCVVAVSGGIDSAVVLGLVAHASKMADSPIKRIVAVLLPVHNTEAATHQPEATSKGHQACAAFGILPVEIDLTQAHSVCRGLVEKALGQEGRGWASGQLVSYQRTPALYYVTSLMTEAGTPAVLVGTTNRDEGSYLGYFGKASDGMVDLQLISDLYKSEVFAVGLHLKVPSSILSAIPTGDMYDGRSDEEVFGASYDAVELFLRAKADPRIKDLSHEYKALDGVRFSQICASLEQLHGYNHHKYLGKSPAVHFDLWDCSVPGGWDYYVFKGTSANKA